MISDIKDHSIDFPPLDSTTKYEYKKYESWVANTDPIWWKPTQISFGKEID